MKTLREVMDEWAQDLPLTKDDLDELDRVVDAWITEGATRYAQIHGTDFDSLVRRIGGC